MAKNTQQPELSMVDQVRIRREKLAQLQQEGQNPFAQTKFEFTSNSAEIKKNFEQMEGKEVSVSGRLMTKRGMGKVMFCDLQDAAGRIQIYLKIDEMDEATFERCRKLDIGDIVGVHGDVFRTQRGEISVRAHEVVLLAKALLPLPDKFHGLTNLETRYRQRYVDLIVNPDVKDTFVKRSLILRELRSFLDGRGFLEVDTPILTPFEIGASARPFYTHHNTLDMDMVLRIETELYLKRLIVGGMDRVYEVGRIFRNEGMDPKPIPEFTTIELYQAYTDFHGMMDLVEDMMKQVAQNVCGSLVVPYQGHEIDLGHWERLTMIDAVKKYSGVDFRDWKTDEDAIASAKAHNVTLPEVPTKGAILAEFFDAFVEEKLIQPTFIYDYPVEISPLSKKDPEHPGYTERFELFVTGKELCNAYSELNDPSVAAIASAETAGLYGLQILSAGINADGDNTTRFIVIERAAAAPAMTGEGQRLAQQFTARHKPGQLAAALYQIGALCFNMECIKSRPLPHVPFEYYFYVQIVCPAGSTGAGCQTLLDTLTSVCSTLRLLGAFTLDSTEK